ncbi:MAG: Ig-like domain-containing protein [Patescibacteria group bacterium]
MDIIKNRYRILVLQTLGGLLLPAFVFAATIESTGIVRLIGVQFQDGRLIGIRLFQIFWLLALLAGGAFAVWSFLQIRKNEDDLFELRKAKRNLIIGSAAAGVSLVMIIVLGLVYWGINRSILKSLEPKSQTIEQIQQQAEVLADFGDVEKIESTYPAPNQRNVARNTSILIKFIDPIDPSSLDGGGGQLKKESVKITPAGTPGQPTEGKVAFAENNRTAKITPVSPLGEPNKRLMYQVSITAAVLSAGGAPLFSENRSYSWQFEVSGFTDDSPPFVESIVPLPNAKGRTEKIAPNALIQITFSEPIDPTTVKNSVIDVRNTGTASPIPGTASIGNNFRTVIFTPSEQCGSNACSEPMFCLPKAASLSVKLRAAKISSDKSIGPNKAVFPYDGIVDAAGNSLDGGGENGVAHNSKSEGSPADDYRAGFATTDALDLTPPAIYSINPGRDMTRIAKNAPLEIVFTKFMDLASLHTGSIRLQPAQNYSVVSSHDFAALRSRSVVQHDDFKENATYSPEVLSEVRDASQNCFSQCIGPTR